MKKLKCDSTSIRYWIDKCETLEKKVVKLERALKIKKINRGIIKKATERNVDAFLNEKREFNLKDSYDAD